VKEEGRGGDVKIRGEEKSGRKGREEGKGKGGKKKGKGEGVRDWKFFLQILASVGKCQGPRACEKK